MYTTSTSSPLLDIGSSSYRSFDKATVLDQIMRQSGDDPSHILFRNILLRLRNCEVTEADWRTLMTRTPAEVSDASTFDNAVHLFPTIEAVVEYSTNKLHACGQSVATIKLFTLAQMLQRPLLLMLVDCSLYFVLLEVLV